MYCVHLIMCVSVKQSISSFCASRSSYVIWIMCVWNDQFHHSVNCNLYSCYEKTLKKNIKYWIYLFTLTLWINRVWNTLKELLDLHDFFFFIYIDMCLDMKRCEEWPTPMSWLPEWKAWGWKWPKMWCSEGSSRSPFRTLRMLAGETLAHRYVMYMYISSPIFIPSYGLEGLEDYNKVYWKGLIARIVSVKFP